MISELKCNGQVAPISVDRRASFTWETDFNQEGFLVRIEKDGKPLLTDDIKSSFCHYEWLGDFDSLSTYRASFECYSGEKTEKKSIEIRTALVGGFPKNCKWIGAGSVEKDKQNFNGNPATYLWKNFSVDKIEPTYLHVAGLGLFVVEIPLHHNRALHLQLAHAVLVLVRQAHFDVGELLPDGAYSRALRAGDRDDG